MVGRQAHVTRLVKGWPIERVRFAVLLGGQELRTYCVEYDPDLAASLVQIGRDFYERCMVGGEQPAVDGAADAARVLAARFPRNKGPLLKVDGEARELVARLLVARAAKADAEKAEEIAAAAVKALIGDADGLTCDLGKVTWKNNKDSQKTDWEAVAGDLAKRLDPALFEAARREFTQTKPGSRVFRVSPAKEG
jgi:predicted phage-related endonuclease